MQERLVELGGIMDQCTQEVDSWQQVYRGDESIYCAAPLPSSPNDIIYLGSDDGTDDAARIAKRQRYEEYGRRYLQGRPLYILSASLRGPFSKASGWQNPWLPKPSSHHAQCLDSLARPPLASSAIRSDSNIPANTPSSEESGTTQGPYDSMDCHLPSPQSHEDLQFFDSPSPGERRTQIESWADNVHRDILEKDDFWAPNHAAVNGHVGSTAKRSAGRDWLKRRPAKRRKPDAFQSIKASYTPTPILPPQSKANRNEPLTQRSINRSFEMTTPSSSTEQGPRESLTLASHQQEVSYEDGQQPIPSNGSTEGSRTPIEPPMPSREGEGEPEMEDESEEEVQNGPQSEYICQDQLPREMPHRSEEMENTIGFHDCADESFFYRTRQLKQPTPTAASSTAVVDCPSQSTQTKEPLAPIYDDSVMVSSNRDAQKSGPKVACDHLNLNESSLAVATNNVTTVESDHILRQYQKPIAPRCSTADTNADTNSRSKVDSSRSLNDITSDPRLNICDAISQTIVEVKEAPCTNPESPLDDGPTLVGDPMDTEEQASIKAAPQNLSIRSEQSLLQHYAISATIMTNASQPSQFCGVTTPYKLNGVESYPIATIPQGGLIESQSTITKPIDQVVQKELTRSITSSNTITGQGCEGEHQTMAGDQTIPASQQSPWAPVHIVNSSVQYDNGNSNNIERAEQSLDGESAKSSTALSNSSASIHCSPTVRLSQQSPWTQEALESANRVRLVQTPSINPVVTIDVDLTGNSQGPILAANEESCSSPAISHIPGCQHQSPESAIGAKEGALPLIQELPYTPMPRIPRKSTPDGDVSIRSFSNFNFSSPQPSVRLQRSSASRSILSIRNNSSRRTTARSSKRVSFATLPHEQEDNSSPPSTGTRAASPPLPTLVDLEEENVDGKYRKHFDVMNRRFTANEMPNLQYYRRLLPSCSQQEPESPSVDAMAEAFREADAHRSNHEGNVFEDTRPEEEEAEEAVIEIEDRPQSPWQQDGEGIDDVAAVIGNLTEFLDVWDVDTEIDRNRVKLNEVGSHGAPSNTEISILHGVGIW